jgi:hypothetical protein
MQGQIDRGRRRYRGRFRNREAKISGGIDPDSDTDTEPGTDNAIPAALSEHFRIRVDKTGMSGYRSKSQSNRKLPVLKNRWSNSALFFPFAELISGGVKWQRLIV